ncbi:MAG: 50S ribosomal protein L29 [Planctomycetes bacterium]|nr:50S ribosomal protein L29 [Planctomycetota bacterium]
MKAEEAHKMSAEELQIETDRLQRHLFDLKSQAVTEKLEDPSQIRKTRRDVARLKTEQRARQIRQSEAAKS